MTELVKRIKRPYQVVISKIFYQVFASQKTLPSFDQSKDSKFLPIKRLYQALISQKTLPSFFPRASTSFNGLTPGDKMKKIGVDGPKPFVNHSVVL